METTRKQSLLEAFPLFLRGVFLDVDLVAEFLEFTHESAGGLAAIDSIEVIRPGS